MPPLPGGPQHCGDILKRLETAVEGPAVHHPERDVRVAVVDALPPGAARDHREDDQPERVHEARDQQLPAEAEAAEGAQGPGPAPLHLRHGLDRVPGDQL